MVPACGGDTSVRLGARGEEKSSYHVCITFRHITFGRAPGVLAVLTRPLHTQRAENTEGADQSSCRQTDKNGGSCGTPAPGRCRLLTDAPPSKAWSRRAQAAHLP